MVHRSFADYQACLSPCAPFISIEDIEWIVLLIKFSLVGSSAAVVVLVTTVSLAKSNCSTIYVVLPHMEKSLTHIILGTFHVYNVMDSRVLSWHRTYSSIFYSVVRIYLAVTAIGSLADVLNFMTVSCSPRLLFFQLHKLHACMHSAIVWLLSLLYIV